MWMATWFVAADVNRGKIVIAFRGSSSLADYATVDNNCTLVSYPSCTGTSCHVHNGFYQSWLEAKAGVAAAVADGFARYPGFGLVATGHSLGAAQALFAALDYRSQGRIVDLVSLSCSL
jgi:hypothetical protein